MKKYLLIIISVLAISSCEKDDFCIEEVTTPKLIIKFKDFEKKSELKKVKSLSVWANEKDSLYKKISVDSIALPLNNSANETIYNLSENNMVTKLKISYKTEDEFISRSCGFRVIYKDIEITNLTSKSWIKELSKTKISMLKNQKDDYITIFH